MRACKYQDEALASCPQAARPGGSGLCYYHSKIIAKKTVRAADVLTETELDSLFAGRPRSDGRRLDAYTKQ